MSSPEVLSVSTLTAAEQTKLRPAARSLALAVASNSERMLAATLTFIDRVGRSIATKYEVPPDAILRPIEETPGGKVVLQYTMPEPPVEPAQGA